MRQFSETITVRSRGRGLYDITGEIETLLHAWPVSRGLVTLFCRHSSASLLIQENADPDVLRDLEDFFRRLVPEDPGGYRHSAEGADDMPAHIRTALTQTSLSVPLDGGRMVLGTWQGIYLYEHRRVAHRRHILCHVIGE